MNKKIFLLSALLFSTTLFTVNCGHNKTKAEDTSAAAPAAVVKASSEDYRNLVTQPVAWKTGKAGKPAPLWAAETKKVRVIRLMASWCPYCKNDLKALNDHVQTGTLKKDQVQIHLITYQNRKENLASVQKFAREISSRYKPFSNQNFTVSYWDKTSNDIEPTKNEQGALLFPEWAGVPYGVVIDCQDNVIFQGHFTNSAEQEAQHYAMIAKAQDSCLK